MKDKIDVGAIGTFGLPNGCTQSAFYSGKFLKNKSLDLNANEIKIFPNTSLFAIRREIVNGEASLLFIKYTFAKEKNSNRGGTFLGSCICFYDSYASPNQISGLLNELHDHLISNEDNILNSVLQVSHSKDLKVKLPNDFEKLNQNLKLPIEEEFFNKNISSTKNFLVYSEGKDEDKLVRFFQNSIAYFTDSETIYFTQDREIAAFVYEKKLLKACSFDEFEKDVDSIKIRKIEEQRQIETLRVAENKRQEEARKEEQRQIEKKKIADELARKEIESKRRILSVKNIPNHTQPIKFEVHKNLVTDYNSLLQLHNEAQHKHEALKGKEKNYNLEDKGAVSNRRKGKTNSIATKYVFYIVIPLLCVLLILSNVYMLFFQEPKIEFSEHIIYKQIESNVLNPLPNSELTQSKKQLLFKKAFKGKKISELVTLLFQHNPEEISGLYSYQKYRYQQHLYQLNKKYFKVEKDTICISDTIEKIPIFKKPKN